ncbi:hypothetical protein [Escherichia coli]|uniref:hypothetical protein n=1 Tax=Escherichia coli TaxID=562 RepID=UPI001D96FE57|nr:hypothetical protein [Escherichia coli]EEQ6383664.1 hypothetical protein [Escherichia coli]EET1884680.1 hypothetical protein [Escherichia coli]EFA2335842.1 hypothetical protein [Escherichia coli]EHK9946440.1 hypothetical protein [Escherichia coli]EIC1165719.1 hypothetical protein [Escherichia coli]
MITSLDDDYADRLADLLEDMHSEGGDPVGLIMSWVRGYADGQMEVNETDVCVFQFEDADMVIKLQEPEKTNSSEVH